MKNIPQSESQVPDLTCIRSGLLTRPPHQIRIIKMFKIKSLKFFFLSSYFFIFLFSYFFAANPVSANVNNIILTQTTQTIQLAQANVEPPAPNAQTPEQTITFTDFLKQFYLYLSRFTMLASFLMVVLAIYVYMTSNGEPKKIGKAKEYLYSAIIGLVAVAFAYTFFEILNPDILNFTAP